MQRFHSFAVVALLAALPATMASVAEAQSRKFNAQLNSVQEVPSAISQGLGNASFTLDPASRKLSWTITYRQLTSEATAAHIHGPATPDQNAGVMIDLAPQGMKSPLVGSVTLTDAQMADLMAGKCYVNLHTSQNKAGEIRGQLYP